MKALYYTIFTLWHGRGSNAVKVFSLSLGLIISILLLAKVGFELSYNRDYREAGNLYSISGIYTFKGVSDVMLVGPLPGKIGELFSGEVESVTTMKPAFEEITHYNGIHNLGVTSTAFADSHFFRTMGIDVLRGNSDNLEGIDHVFISGKLARMVFGDKDLVGEILVYNKAFSVIARGVFADISDNANWKYDVIVSFPTLFKIYPEFVSK